MIYWLSQTLAYLLTIFQKKISNILMNFPVSSFIYDSVNTNIGLTLKYQPSSKCHLTLNPVTVVSIESHFEQYHKPYRV